MPLAAARPAAAGSTARRAAAQAALRSRRSCCQRMPLLPLALTASRQAAQRASAAWRRRPPGAHWRRRGLQKQRHRQRTRQQGPSARSGVAPARAASPGSIHAALLPAACCPSPRLPHPRPQLTPLREAGRTAFSRLVTAKPFCRPTAIAIVLSGQ